MKPVILAAAAIAVSAAATMAEERREADAHEHGHGKFQMAIEDDHVVIELEVPAFDILGFEHAPSTPEQRGAIAEAAIALSSPDALFAMTEEAGCAIGQVEIGFGATGGHRHEHGGEGEEHEEHDHADHKEHAEHDHEDEHDHDEEKDAHSEVTAYYRLACENPQALDRIEFGYFASFPNAEELEVVVLSARGQSAGEVNGSDTVFEIE